MHIVGSSSLAPVNLTRSDNIICSSSRIVVRQEYNSSNGVSSSSNDVNSGSNNNVNR